MTEIQQFVKKLQTSAWRTAGARYNAARRLQRRSRVAGFSIAMFAIVGVVLAVVERIYSFQAGSAIDNYLTSLSVCIGLFVVVISLIDSGEHNDLRQAMLHRNAEDLGELQREIGFAIAADQSGEIPLKATEVAALRERYEETKRRCSYNHEPVDDELFKATQAAAPEFLDANGKSIGMLNIYLIRIHAFFQPIWYFCMLWMVIFTLLGLTTFVTR